MEGVMWDEDALTEVVELADGYPFFLQLYASEAWTEASRSGPFGSITKQHVDRAVPAVRRLLEHGMYGGRYEQTTATQRDYLYAMVDLMNLDPDDTVQTKRVRSGDIARKLGRPISAVAPTRDALIRAGLIHSPSYGELELSIPGFAQYLDLRRVEG
jgi:hypothetical protein